MRRVPIGPSAAVCVAVLSAVGPYAAARAQTGSSRPPRLQFPLACTLGETCWIQHYVDRDPAGPPRDYTCGSLTYKAHNGTDIRVPDMAAERAGVDVLAVADGRVLRLRDGVADISVRSTGIEAVKDIECGNGLVIDHGGGWSTQYCHMAKDSLAVHPGEAVRAGQKLGHVGLSGETEFPHLHITVRHDDQVIDPFAPAVGKGASCGGGIGLWAKPIVYTPRAVINAGFAAKAIDMAAIEAGDISRPDAQAPYLVAYVRTIGLRAGDEPSLTLMAPDGRVLAPSPPAKLDRDFEQRFLMVGQKRPAGGWGKGAYRARYVVSAGGRVVLQRDFAVTINSE